MEAERTAAVGEAVAPAVAEGLAAVGVVTRTFHSSP